MRFVCTEQCELPFMLNLVTGAYQVFLDGTAYDLEVLQEQVAVHLADGQFAVGAPASLNGQLGLAYDQAHKQSLRTVARHVTTKEIAESDLPAITDDAVLEDMQSAIIGESPMAYAGKSDDLKKEAEHRIKSMSPDELTAYRLRSAKLRASRKLPSPDLFLAALNTLIRLYMQRFSDFFVEEITLHQLAAQSPLMGIFVHIECDRVHLHNYGYVGKMPPIMRRPWLAHPQSQIDQFMDDLKNGVTPDSVSLLEVRARGFLERGATRSAIIEASAALDLSVTRKLRQGFAKQGKSATDMDTILKSEINFKKRVNKLMNQATSKRVADLDYTLYQTVVGHREKYRHGIAHADVEPSEQDAQLAIQDFGRLRKLVDGISV
jgi:hypothetical protein